MARYIDADALMDFLTIIPIDLGYREIDDVKEFVKRQPTADVTTVRRGRWIFNQYDANPQIGNWHCSECGKITIMPHDVCNYCPNCGAKMDGGAGDD